MAVILANTMLTARKKTHGYAKDAHGVRVAAPGYEAPVGPFPGAVTEPPDGPSSTTMPWSIRADARLHPLRPDDELTDSLGRVFIVRAAKLVTVPGYDYVDFIKVQADPNPPYQQ